MVPGMFEVSPGQLKGRLPRVEGFSGLLERSPGSEQALNLNSAVEIAAREPKEHKGNCFEYPELNS